MQYWAYCYINFRFRFQCNRWLYKSVFFEDEKLEKLFIVVESCEKAIKLYVQEDDGLLMSRKNLPKTIRLADLGNLVSRSHISNYPLVFVRLTQ